MVGNMIGKKVRGKPYVILLTIFRSAKNHDPEKVGKELCNLINTLQGIKCIIGPKPYSLKSILFVMEEFAV